MGFKGKRRRGAQAGSVLQAEQPRAGPGPPDPPRINDLKRLGPRWKPASCPG